MVIMLLEKYHDSKNFECEEESLSDYIKMLVSQDITKSLATCFVAVDDKQNVIGYYTLTSESLGRHLIPQKYIKQVAKNYNAPVILLGRLARDIAAKGTGVGEHMLLDALLRSYILSQKGLDAMAVIVDPINEFAVLFYKKYSFEKLPDSEKMFLPMNIIGQLV